MAVVTVAGISPTLRSRRADWGEARNPPIRWRNGRLRFANPPYGRNALARSESGKCLSYHAASGAKVAYRKLRAK
jgi:hypothetical protein